MKIIAMVPTRNEDWVIEHSLAALSGFCDVVLIGDRQSDDRTREICRHFPKAVLVEAPADSRIREQRWQLLDAARGYDGHNLLWATDADELVSPGAANAFLAREARRLTPGTALECRYYHLWNSAARYRDDLSYYAPQWKQVGFVDDRRADFDRSNATALHEPRVPAPDGAPSVQEESLRLLHLQWVIPERNQMKQAWYRCREWLDGGLSAFDINRHYATTFPATRARTTAVPGAWVADLTLPDASADREASWHQRDILAWFDQFGIERFEPIEIWFIPALRDEFRRRVGRAPRPDRSYLPPWRSRAAHFGRRVFHAARRRLAV
jgi:hypothetical protein